MYELTKGVPVLGCHMMENGVNFGIYADKIELLILNVYQRYDSLEPIVTAQLKGENWSSGDIFHVFITDIEEGMAYEWRVLKDKVWSIGVIDPYAYSVKEFPIESNKYRNLIVKLEAYNMNRPKIPWEKTIIYELHVGAFTKHPSAAVQYPGTFKGIIQKIPYLKSLGVTTIELLPIFKWNKYTLQHKHPITGEKMKDIWGYNTIAFFALEDDYSSNHEPLEEIKEFKELVDAVHSEGMEIILDVVYNHTGEGGADGRVFNFKILANEIYYKINEEGYMNCSGTGNTLNASHYIVKKLILDSLRYWVVYMGVDGFRFDLASILGQDKRGIWCEESVIKDITEDPILSKVKLISESWDAKGCYDVGRMPYPITEWSDKFRDTVRRFVRGDLGQTKELSECLLSKEITFKDIRKYEQHAIHFITAHDGFTLWDLVSYEKKHNEINGENNQDGNNTNWSSNCGIEGETTDLEVIDLRKRRMRNSMILLLLARGIPMLLMGDEIGRTQKGNNNAYCQDNEILWMNWERREIFKDISVLIKKIIGIRNECIDIWKEKNYEESWHGTKLNQPDFSYYSRSLAYKLEYNKISYYIIINSYVESLVFELPYADKGWMKMIDTYEEYSEVEVFKMKYRARPFSICILKKIN